LTPGIHAIDEPSIRELALSARASPMTRFSTAIFLVGIEMLLATVAGVSQTNAHESTRSMSSITFAQSKEAAKPSASRPAYPRFPRKTPYAKARESLLASNWKPEISTDADPCEPGDARCQGRPEMESCAGTGEGNCLFLWRNDNMVIAITTHDDPPLVSRVQCRSGCR
jgi:hypothetical protein